jgi:hypothetical protein
LITTEIHDYIRNLKSARIIYVFVRGRFRLVAACGYDAEADDPSVTNHAGALKGSRSGSGAWPDSAGG